MRLQTINNTNIAIKEYHGQRVVTFKDIDAVHGRPDGTARKRFNDNRQHFVENEDYFVVNQPSEIRTLGIQRPQGGTPENVTLMTESGYLMLAKSFTDELAWKVQRQLVNGYFRARDFQNQFATLSPQLQTLINIEMRQQEAEHRMAALEASSAETSQTMETIKDAFETMVSPSVTAENWQSQMNRNVRAFCMQTGFDFHKTFQQLYKELESTAGVKLDIRAKFAKERLRAAGAAQDEIASVSKIGIIAKDKKLREIFRSLFNNMVARYKLSEANT